MDTKCLLIHQIFQLKVLTYYLTVKDSKKAKNVLNVLHLLEINVSKYKDKAKIMGLEVCENLEEYNLQQHYTYNVPLSTNSLMCLLLTK